MQASARRSDMKARLLFGCLILLGVTAFAPAPFPRSGRARLAAVAVEQIQGIWTILKLEMTDDKGGMTDQGNYLAEIQIVNQRWNFVYRNPNNQPVGYLLAIDATRTPAAIDLTLQGQGKAYGT